MAASLTSRGFLTGLMFAGFGLGTLLLVAGLPWGSTVDMGPGFVPKILASLLIAFGAVISIQALVKGSEPVGRLHLAPIGLITVGIVAFALLIEPAGLVPAGVIMLAMAAYAGHEFNIKEAIVTTIVLLFICAVIFKLGLGLNFALVRGIW